MQLVVIAKEPRPGRVKTRLCPPLVPAEAARLAEAALVDTLRVVRATPARRRVLALDGAPGPWLPTGFDVIRQRGESLGDRLAAAVEDCAATSAEPLVVLGMDTPQVAPGPLAAIGAVLAHARSHRRRVALVGPATDGGWWLLGLSHPDASVFAGVEMSSPATGAQQVARLRDRGFAVRLLDPMVDVDTYADAAAVAALAPTTAFAAAFRALAAQVA